MPCGGNAELLRGGRGKVTLGLGTALMFQGSSSKPLIPGISGSGQDVSGGGFLRLFYRAHRVSDDMKQSRILRILLVVHMLWKVTHIY